MSMYAVDGDTLTSIANAIRNKTGSDNQMTVSDMAISIENIKSSNDAGLIISKENAIKLISNKYIFRGNENNASGWSASDYIDVSNGILIKNYSIQASYCAFYDENKNYISKYSVADYLIETKTNGELEYTIFYFPSDVKYLRISGQSTSMSKAIVKSIIKGKIIEE